MEEKGEGGFNNGLHITKKTSIYCKRCSKSAIQDRMNVPVGRRLITHLSKGAFFRAVNLFWLRLVTPVKALNTCCVSSAPPNVT